MVIRRNGAKWAFPVSRFPLWLCAPPPSTISLHRVKPAIFDLLLAVCIAAYLGMMYLAIQVSHWNAVGCSPSETRAPLHKRVSEYLRILIDAAAESAPFGDEAAEWHIDPSRLEFELLLSELLALGEPACRERRELQSHSADVSLSSASCTRGGGAAAMSIPVHQWPTRCHSSCSARRKLTNCRLLSMSSKSCLQVASFKFLIFNQNSSF